jgi:hypothetical protein
VRDDASRQKLARESARTTFGRRLLKRASVSSCTTQQRSSRVAKGKHQCLCKRNDMWKVWQHRRIEQRRCPRTEPDAGNWRQAPARGRRGQRITCGATAWADENHGRRNRDANATKNAERPLGFSRSPEVCTSRALRSTTALGIIAVGTTQGSKHTDSPQHLTRTWAPPLGADDRWDRETPFAALEDLREANALAPALGRSRSPTVVPLLGPLYHLQPPPRAP